MLKKLSLFSLYYVICKIFLKFHDIIAIHHNNNYTNIEENVITFLKKIAPLTVHTNNNNIKYMKQISWTFRKF